MPIKCLLPSARRPRRILSGPLSRLSIHLDLREGDLQLRAGLYERETYKALHRFIADARSAIDIGSAKSEPHIAQVVAVEPAESELARFQANLAANPWIATDRLRIHAGFAGAVIAPLCRTNNALASELPAPIFIKMDIDGPEAVALATCRQALRRDCRLLIETHSPEAETECMRFLNGQGYTPRGIRPAWWRLLVPEHRPIPQNRWLAAWRNH